MMKRSDDYQGLINALERRVRELEARLAAAEARIAALELREAGYRVQPLPGIAPGQPCNPPPGWPWYEVTCGSGTVQHDTSPAVPTNPLGPAT